MDENIAQVLRQSLVTTGDVGVNNVAHSGSEISNDQRACLYRLTNVNVAQLLEQSRHSFSIPTADVEEATAVLSGSGISIHQQAHLRDINSCISALRLAYRITLECAMEKIVAVRDRVLNPQD